jgi:predicted ATP-dependent endonuclease of OLD family
MKISRTEIRNFRSIRRFELELDGESMFVIGENAGETSLLTAVARAFGSDPSFRAEDFADARLALEARGARGADVAVAAGRA